GITLVELLAALGLFVIVIALSSTIIIQLINSEEETGDEIDLTQNSNVLISELRNQYFHSCMESETESTSCNLQFEYTDNIKIKEFVVNSGEKMQIEDKIIKNVPKQETLPIKI